jgi:hypothetical protein
MTAPHALPERIFDRIVLGHPKTILVCLAVAIAFLAYWARDFRLDASAETLVLQNDEDLRYSRLINERYGQQEFLFLTYTPRGDLFSERSLAQLGRLQKELSELKGVASVDSILNVPLLESPRVPIKELAGSIRTLQSPQTDLTLAREEFRNSPIYRDLLVSPDLEITALQINLPVDETYDTLLSRRNELRDKQKTGRLSAAEAAEFEAVVEEFRRYRDYSRQKRHELIAAVRDVMDKYRDGAELFLGGVSMIADDMISFIKSDLRIFGIGVLCLLILTMYLIFRRIRWILVPMLCCGSAALSMIGLLGLFGWEVTVISSNFISLQLILTLSINIHLVVRYNELYSREPDADQRALVRETVRLKFIPCLYATLTTIAGFGSLVMCDILPVINFGWMMITGLGVSLIITFLLFPASLMLLEKPPFIERRGKRTVALLPMLADVTQRHGKIILIGAALVFAAGIAGASRLRVENSFINYFKNETEIYRGLKVIDQSLGGTTPLDVIVDLASPEPATATDGGADGDRRDIFDEFAEFETAPTEDKYWFTAEKMAQVVEIHDYLDGLPETGKVLSLGTLMKVAERFNEGQPLDNFQLALLYGEIPGKFRDSLLRPYVSVEHDQVRFFVRIKDSLQTLKRNELLQTIRQDLVNELGLKKEQVRLTGLMVLYNNMLQSLFDSQIVTLGITLLALTGMFLLLFRSVKIALIAIFPNLLSIAVVLGFMGWAGMPLDMMTITIAAISVGIAVDDTIHFIHRFKEEFKRNADYSGAVQRCHRSIGYAMYYTSITIIIGFSILSLSNFIPTIYFGLLTSLAMLIALLGALTLLPEMMLVFKPLGPEARKAGRESGTGTTL